MPTLFGTDGIRGVANHDLTPDLALAVGRAAGRVLAPNGGEVVIGRDTRVSGSMLQGALIAGLCSAGVDVRICGVLPTPGIAFLTVDERARAGAVVSASHNPVADNGIKFFSNQGHKIEAELEDDIEGLMTAPPEDLPAGVDVGRGIPLEGAQQRYCDHLVTAIDGDLGGLRVVLDCAYGAAWKVGPDAFHDAGASLVALNCEPDGARINVDCGSTSMHVLSRRVVAEKADLGLALDGDADRVLAVDETGREIDGDRILGIAALWLMEQGTLKNNVVVATVMSNLGFVRALEERGIEVVATPVGDRYVAQAMVDAGAVLGGEQSGHVIFGEQATTGDGLLAGIQLASIMVRTGRPLSELADLFEPFPQVLVNVEVEGKQRLESAEALWDEVRRREEELGDDGRVLLRASGTEPVVRVMVEARDPEVADRTAGWIAGRVRSHLGG